MKMHLVYVIALGLVASLSTTPSHAKVWQQKLMGSASSGLDLAKNKTQVSEVYLQVLGPEVDQAAENVVKECSGLGLATAYSAFEATPTEPAEKLAAALAAFKATFIGCLAPASGVHILIDQYEVKLNTVEKWQDGVFIQIDVPNPSAEVAKDIAKKVLPPDLKKPGEAAIEVVLPPTHIDTKKPLDNIPTVRVIKKLFH
jgi:hypothetical protein